MSEEARKNNLRQPISKTELERRWRVTRNQMEKAKIDCLVMENNFTYLGGAVRYYTDFPAGPYGSSVVFTLNNGLTMINHGAPLFPFPPEWAVIEGMERVNDSYLPSFNYTSSFAPKAAVNAIKKAKAKTVGLVGLSMMTVAYNDYLKENLPGVVFKDATNMVDAIRAVKSEEEIALIKKTALEQDMTMAAALSFIRPGIREFELASEIKRICSNRGHETLVVLMGSAPAGTPSGMHDDFFQTRTLQNGDCMLLLIETSGAGGYWCEIARNICIADIPNSMKKAWADNIVIQKEDAKMLKPGVTPKEIFDAHNKLMVEMGYPAEVRLLGHSQGYEIVERPALRPDEPMKLENGMMTSIHPTTATKEVFAMCNDDFLITNKGGVRIHTFPQDLQVV